MVEPFCFAFPFRDVARRLRSRDAGRSILRVFYDEDIGLSAPSKFFARCFANPCSGRIPPSFTREGIIAVCRSLTRFEFEFSKGKVSFRHRNEVSFFSSRRFGHR